MNTAKPSAPSSKILCRISGKRLANEREKPVRTLLKLRLDAHRTFLDKSARFDIEAEYGISGGLDSMRDGFQQQTKQFLMYSNLYYNVI